MPETCRLTTRSVWENAAPSATGSRRGTPGASLARRLNPQVRNMGSRLCSLAGRLRCAGVIDQAGTNDEGDVAREQGGPRPSLTSCSAPFEARRVHQATAAKACLLPPSSPPALPTYSGMKR